MSIMATAVPVYDRTGSPKTSKPQPKATRTLRDDQMPWARAKPALRTAKYPAVPPGTMSKPLIKP
eukprot:scaffold6701_cov181-Amphora_coffeaeformis.AAC.3